MTLLCVYVCTLLRARLCLFPDADRIEAVRRELARYNINSDEAGTIQCLELLGEGTYGKVGGKGLKSGCGKQLRHAVGSE